MDEFPFQLMLPPPPAGPKNRTKVGELGWWALVHGTSALNEVLLWRHHFLDGSELH